MLYIHTTVGCVLEKVLYYTHEEIKISYLAYKSKIHYLSHQSFDPNLTDPNIRLLQPLIASCTYKHCKRVLSHTQHGKIRRLGKRDRCCKQYGLKKILKASKHRGVRSHLDLRRRVRVKLHKQGGNQAKCCEFPLLSDHSLLPAHTSRLPSFVLRGVASGAYAIASAPEPSAMQQGFETPALP